MARAGAKRLTFAVVAALPLWPGGGAAAHGLGSSQLRLRVDGARVDGAWDVQLGPGSLAIAWVAALWFVERAFGVPIFSATG